jgi:hypothetical protein
MILAGQTAKGFADFIGRGSAGDSKSLVVVFEFDWHNINALRGTMAQALPARPQLTTFDAGW